MDAVGFLCGYVGIFEEADGDFEGVISLEWAIAAASREGSKVGSSLVMFPVWDVFAKAVALSSLPIAMLANAMPESISL